MPPKITEKEWERRLQAGGGLPDRLKLAGKRVLKELDPYTEKNRHKDHDLEDEQIKQHFIIFLTMLLKGRGADGAPNETYVEQRWKEFTAQWRRMHENKLPDKVVNSGTMELHNFITLNREISERDYLTLIHFKNLLRQLWQNDWYLYPFPIYRVYVSSLLKHFTYSSGRVGEYLESTARLGSARGLYVPGSMTILVIRNRSGRPELVVALKRDAKGMTKKQKKHPRHSMPEDIGSLPLCLNPVLEPLVLCLARGLFHDFKTADEIFSLEPSADEGSYELALCKPTVPLFGPHSPFPKEEDVGLESASRKQLSKGKGSMKTVIGTLLYEAISDDGPTGKILTASWFGKELPRLGRRAGYVRSITVHDIRAEALVRADDAIQGSSSVFLQSCARIWRTDRQEFVQLNARIEELNRKIRASGTSEEECQKLEGTAAEEDEHSVSYHWRWFDRVAHLMPEQKRLSEMLFLCVPLRSSEGRQVIDDMMTLCRRRSPVSDHPALKAESGRCPAGGCGIDVESLSTRQRWKHIYRCQKTTLKKQHGFSDLCPICHQWYTDEWEFEAHCQYHIDHPATIPLEHGFLEVRGTLAWPGFCPRCLGDRGKQARHRMAAFYDQQLLTRHMNRHYDDPALRLDCGSIHGCDLLFTSIRELQHHYDDLHSEDDMELEVHVTTPESFKRKRVDIDDEGAAKRLRKLESAKLASNETGTAEPGIVGSGLAHINAECSHSVIDSEYSSCAKSPDSYRHI
ncbi:predicted protein [Histoplasma mississippiense (nom. inval.)]|uniref:predicted protein n=1 Tax=Ajellomyces capsulatus (strain NAm1 / WU24) TaxID=2059318 RepID=UPI000157C963|nr:predicted protein [Histoplasma mississippiense (nom. inval.)]EDN09247.1 predicted protein [Histoplasma mississippiense (nom. inval.)]